MNGQKRDLILELIAYWKQPFPRLYEALGRVCELSRCSLLISNNQVIGAILFLFT